MCVFPGTSQLHRGFDQFRAIDVRDRSHDSVRNSFDDVHDRMPKMDKKEIIRIN